MLAITHLLTVGFIGMVIVGALQQLFPVLVGVRLSHPVFFSRLIYGGLVMGVLSLCGGFLMVQPKVIGFGGAILGLSFLCLLVRLGSAVFKSKAIANVTKGMKLALVGMLLTIALGLYLAAAYTSSDIPLHRFMTELHFQWGILGWAGMLIITVSYQVVPMFQVTPKYPQKMITWLGPSIFVSLIMITATRFWFFLSGDVATYEISALELVLFCGYSFYAIVTMRLQLQRRRKVPDITLAYWRFGLSCLLAAALIWSLVKGTLIDHQQLELALGVLIIVGFIMSLITGMLYKIIPFLVWLHLTNSIDMSARWELKIPNMKEIIPDRHARNQFRLHLLAVSLILISLLVKWLVPFAAGVFMASNLYLAFNLVCGALMYGHTLQQAQPA